MAVCPRAVQLSFLPPQLGANPARAEAVPGTGGVLVKGSVAESQLAPFGLLQLSLAPFGSVWACLSVFGLVWLRLAQFGLVCLGCSLV